MTPEPSARTLRVATFNIRHGAGLDNLVDLERTARVIEETGAEVIALQEVDRHFGSRSDFVDQPTWLGDRLGMEVGFGANVDLDPPAPGAPRRQYGTAVLSRHPVLMAHNTLLPRPEAGEPRGLLQARVTVDGVTLRVFTTHLQKGSRIERLAEVERIREVVAEGDEPAVLMGDMNARPSSPEIAAMTQDVTDVWAQMGIGDGYTHHAKRPSARIDYVLLGHGLVARSAAVVSTDASDHLPVAVIVAFASADVEAGAVAGQLMNER